MKIKLPKFGFKFRNPFSKGLNLTKLRSRLFSFKTKKSRRFTWKSALKICLWGLGAFVLLIVFLFAWFAKDLPTPGKIRGLETAGSTRLYDRNMKPLYTISGEKKRILVDSKDIPENVKQATIALEDHQFYSHIGINTRGMARALLFGGSRGGGSTITQQLARNTLLSSQHSVTRKIKEAILAVEIEMLYSKDQILTMYLNEIPYGGNNYGIEAASRAFFSKSAKDLTLAEATTLASLPQQPSTLSPYGTHVDKLITRRNFALDQMFELGFATKDQTEAAKKEVPKFSAKHDSITAPHFVLFVKDWLVTYFTSELKDRQLAEQRVEEGGLSVVTTLDLDKQLIAEDVVSKAKDTTLKRAGASNAGLVSIDPKRGEILAMVGSVDYFQEQFGAYNIATAQRQPGSSFKPIVYATAFKDKYNPAFNLFDVKTDFGNYTPDNFDGGFRGPITIRRALGNSLNIPAVKTLALVGLDKALKTAHDMGITTLNDKNRYGLALVLGGGEVKLIDMTTAYGVFANKGVLMPTTPVLKITDSKNETIYTHEDPKDGQQVLDPQVAYEISSILSDSEAKKPTFGRTLGVLTLGNRPVTSKTGTTDSYRDAWTLGYTPQFVTGVWAGNNDNTPMNHAGGSVAAAPIWHDYMDRIHKGLPIEPFVRPDGIKDVTVDQLSNKLPSDGSQTITDIFTRWQVPTENDDVHVRVRVCKENGLLADGSIPDNLAELRTFVNVHSEKPDNPNWEGPVQAWAVANGLTNKPPTQKCQQGNVNPTIDITSPADGQEVSGVMDITASASAPSGVKQVDFLIDGTGISSDTTAPYGASYDTAFLSAGNHKITATVTSNSNSTASKDITVKVVKDTTPPGDISNLSHIFLGGGAIKFSWDDPTDIDLKLIRIYVYTSPGDVLTRTVEVDKGSLTSTLTGLSGKWKFIFKAVDYAGNESPGITEIDTIP